MIHIFMCMYMYLFGSTYRNSFGIQNQLVSSLTCYIIGLSMVIIDDPITSVECLSKPIRRQEPSHVILGQCAIRAISQCWKLPVTEAAKGN